MIVSPSTGMHACLLPSRRYLKKSVDILLSVIDEAFFCFKQSLTPFVVLRLVDKDENNLPLLKLDILLICETSPADAAAFILSTFSCKVQIFLFLL